jgi:hypothetical protein
MIKEGEIIMKGSHREILSDMSGKVYRIRTRDENQVAEIQPKYKVVNLQRGIDFTELRIVSDKVVTYANAEVIEPKFEDVYMFYFDLENTKEV